ncbi:MAG: dihydropteroate synthase [Gammaproteobacteria bacterium]|nr:dihydropteroate synthase [Gammaproteobacteria bacterium]MBT6480430.1 dihydropteroate synthase [Gammaproteobacteria bacterium]MBT7226934.1 dihydropteroate synthase [Gammaproteobacteria bacterium]
MDCLTAGDRQIDLSTPVCMGIINATPDSFSDGAELQRSGTTSFQLDIDKALFRAETMVAEGATFVDVGGESTRPGAATVSEQEELDRVIPLIAAISASLDVCVSIDTSSPVVMKEALDSGAQLINDIRALAIPGAAELLASTKAAVCLMHMQGAPSTMQKTPSYGSVVLEVFDFLKSRVAYSLECGIEQDRLLIDPGFGFGKTVQHNYQLLKNLGYFSQLEIPLLVGLSRKSMIGEVVARPVEQRLAGSIAATTLALASGARIIRTHDVAATMDAIRVNLSYSSAE